MKSERWTCHVCLAVFGRRSAHTTGGDRCKAFANARELMEAEYVPVSAELAVRASQHAPRLIVYKKSVLSNNEPIKSHAWIPGWLAVVLDHYVLMKGIDFAKAFSSWNGHRPGVDLDEELDDPDDESTSLHSQLPKLINIINGDETLQRALLATAALSGNGHDLFEQQRAPDPVYIFLKGVLDGSK